MLNKIVYNLINTTRSEERFFIVLNLYPVVLRDEQFNEIHKKHLEGTHKNSWYRDTLEVYMLENRDEVCHQYLKEHMTDEDFSTIVFNCLKKLVSSIEEITKEMVKHVDSIKIQEVNIRIYKLMAYLKPDQFILLYHSYYIVSDIGSEYVKINSVIYLLNQEVTENNGYLGNIVSHPFVAFLMSQTGVSNISSLITILLMKASNQFIYHDQVKDLYNKCLSSYCRNTNGELLQILQELELYMMLYNSSLHNCISNTPHINLLDDGFIKKIEETVKNPVIIAQLIRNYLIAPSYVMSESVKEQCIAKLVNYVKYKPNMEIANIIKEFSIIHSDLIIPNVQLLPGKLHLLKDLFAIYSQFNNYNRAPFNDLLVQHPMVARLTTTTTTTQDYRTPAAINDTTTPLSLQDNLTAISNHINFDINDKCIQFNGLINRESDNLDNLEEIKSFLEKTFSDDKDKGKIQECLNNISNKVDDIKRLNRLMRHVD
ncbi:MAG: hypothetical protein QG673_1315 [Pseudomonadota bacterium]|nr:hypothetical protein [Pseudomonadota bacterium]